MEDFRKALLFIGGAFLRFLAFDIISMYKTFNFVHLIFVDKQRRTVLFDKSAFNSLDTYPLHVIDFNVVILAINFYLVVRPIFVCGILRGKRYNCVAR